MVDRKNIAEILRVNHAGEYGAVRIYQGQLSVLSGDSKIEHMLLQEQEHLKTFNKLLIDNEVSASIFQPLWHGLAYGLGKVTAMMGEQFAHHCTIAVETVIDEHYQKQIEIFENSTDEQETELKDILVKFRQEELEHKQISENIITSETPSGALMQTIIKNITKAAIAISSKI